MILLLLALLAAPASAQTDADFAASLTAGAPTAVQFAQVKAKARKPAAPAPKAPPAADEALWAKALETIQRDGKYKPGNDFMPGSFSIEESTGDPKGARTMRVLSVLGMLNEEEQFEPMGAMLVLMEFTIDAKGNTVLSQWLIQTDIYGEIGEAAHGTITKSPDGKTLGTTHSALDDAKTKAQLDSMLKHWAERKPAGA